MARPVKRYRQHVFQRCCLAALVLMGAVATCAHGAELSLEQVKAAYVYNFCRLTTFPDLSEGETVNVWVVQTPSRALREAFQALEARAVNRREIAVSFVEQPKRVNVAYWDSAPDLQEACPVQLGPEVLTIGCNATFFECGGMIRLVEVARNLRFFLNSEALKRSRLELSSRLLRHALNSSGLPGHAE